VCRGADAGRHLLRSQRAARFFAARAPPRAQIDCRTSGIVSRLRWRVGLPHDQESLRSLRDLRSRGGQNLPALIAARFASRIATIFFACERESSLRPA
jgi:hypothetical protein